MSKPTRKRAFSTGAGLFFSVLLALALMFGAGCGQKEDVLEQQPVEVSKVVRKPVVRAPFPEDTVAVAVKPPETPLGTLPVPSVPEPVGETIPEPAPISDDIPMPLPASDAEPVADRIDIVVDEQEDPILFADIGEVSLDLGYTYNPAGKVDPFMPPIQQQERATADAAPEIRRRTAPRTPLERFDISQLKLVAVLRAGDEAMAMIEVPDGKGHVVRQGSYVGDKDGQIVEISRDRILVEEIVTDLLGRVTSSPQELRLQKKAGE